MTTWTFLTLPYTPHAFIRTEKGIIQAELFIIDAPLTVANFMKLAREGFYNGLSVDRVLPNFRIEAGDPRGDGHGGPGYTVRSEVNRRPFLRGTLGMTLPGGKDTAGSQFFITHLPQPQLAGTYTAFGQVIKGDGLGGRIGARRRHSEGGDLGRSDDPFRPDYPCRSDLT